MLQIEPTGHSGDLQDTNEQGVKDSGLAMAYQIEVNGVKRGRCHGDTPLRWVLRDVFGMTGTKFGCGMALCGACTVHLDGNAVCSCITTTDRQAAAQVSGRYRGA